MKLRGQLGQGSRGARAFTARHMSNQIPLVAGGQASIRALSEAGDSAGLTESQPDQLLGRPHAREEAVGTGAGRQVAMPCPPWLTSDLSLAVFPDISADCAMQMGRFALFRVSFMHKNH